MYGKQYMKIPPSKYDVTPSKCDVAFAFNKWNSTGQHIISCEDILFVKGSIA